MFVDEDGFTLYFHGQGIGVELQERPHRGRSVHEPDQHPLSHEGLLRVLWFRRLFPLRGLTLLRCPLPHLGLGHDALSIPCASNKGQRSNWFLLTLKHSLHHLVPRNPEVLRFHLGMLLPTNPHQVEKRCTESSLGH